MMSNDERADALRAAGKGNGWSSLPSGPQKRCSPLHSHAPAKNASVPDGAKVREAMAPRLPQDLAPVVGSTTLHAARGDDDLMSKPPTRPRLADKAKSDRWKQQIGAARLMWDKLSDEELASSGGRRSELAELVRIRYAVTRATADLQVRTFLQTHAT